MKRLQLVIDDKPIMTWVFTEDHIYLDNFIVWLKSGILVNNFSKGKLELSEKVYDYKVEKTILL